MSKKIAIQLYGIDESLVAQMELYDDRLAEAFLTAFRKWRDG